MLSKVVHPADLARLPWFDLVAGELVADPAVGPVIDAHTHLALSYLRRPTVDLTAASPAVESYLPRNAPVDLDVYANRNLSQEALAALTKDLTVASLGPGGMRATHTLANLGVEMSRMHITRSVLHAIDMPWGLSRNAETWLHLTSGDSRFAVFGSVHPYDRRPRTRLLAQRTAGARGIKVHPAVQLVAPSSRAATHLYRWCGQAGMPVFFHCGPVDIEPRLGRYLSQVAGYERGIAANPGTTFVLGHSGALQWRQALELAQRYPNVWLELASQSVSAVRAILSGGPTDRIVFGSDWPFYPQATGIAKVMLATDGDAALARAVLHDNAARLLADSHRPL